MSHAVCANPTSASRKGRRLLPSTVRRPSITRQRVPKLEPGIFFKDKLAEQTKQKKAEKTKQKKAKKRPLSGGSDHCATKKQKTS